MERDPCPVCKSTGYCILAGEKGAPFHPAPDTRPPEVRRRKVKYHIYTRQSPPRPPSPTFVDEWIDCGVLEVEPGEPFFIDLRGSADDRVKIVPEP